MTDKAVRCPECDSPEIELAWINAENNCVGIEYQQGYCSACDYDWNECSRDYPKEPSQ